jgi:hypothetical protein
MIARDESQGGFSVLDGAALVSGAAVASVHIRGTVAENFTQPGSVLIWGCFAWIAVTASGPFLLPVRLYARRLPDYPKVGDRLWALIGLPWVLTALIRPAATSGVGHRQDLYAIALSVGLGVVSMVAIVVVWGTWVMVSPQEAARTSSAPWTNRVGLVLAVAWPIQCGIGLVMIE